MNYRLNELTKEELTELRDQARELERALSGVLKLAKSPPSSSSLLDPRIFSLREFLNAHCNVTGDLSHTIKLIDLTSLYNSTVDANLQISNYIMDRKLAQAIQNTDMENLISSERKRMYKLLHGLKLKSDLQ